MIFFVQVIKIFKEAPKRPQEVFTLIRDENYFWKIALVVSKQFTKATRQTDFKLTIQHMIKRKTKILTLFCDATIKGFYYTSF